jgi:gluconate 2-dehydrogenase gamma chain
MSVDRRQFCQQVVYVGFGSYLALAAGACRDRDEHAPSPSAAAAPAPTDLMFLTAMEYQTLAAACERLYPADEDPGAIALGAPGFIDRELASDAFSGWQETFRTGLADLDADAVARHGRPFAQLPPPEQDAVLSSWVHGSRPRATFVSRMMHLTLEGVFSDPVHGGNKDGAAWSIVGFAPSLPRPGGHHM